MTVTDRVSHLSVVPDPTEPRPKAVPYATWAAQRVQDYAERTADENPLIVAQACGIMLGHPVDVTDLVDLADAMEDVRRAEDPREAAYRQVSVDEITVKIVNGPACRAVTR